MMDVRVRRRLPQGRNSSVDQPGSWGIFKGTCSQFSSFHCCPPPISSLIPQGQTHLVNPADATAYSSITAALTQATLQQGDQVVVVGIQVGGLPAAYSETPIVPGQTAETFPLVLPVGIQLVATGTDPVLIARTQAGVEPLIQIVPSAFSGASVVEGLRLLGGDVGVSLDSGATASLPVEIRTCRFIRNRIGVSAVAENGAELDLLVDGCVFEPSTVMYPQAVVLQTPAVGIRLHAKQDTGTSLVPRVDATVSGGNLKQGYPSTAKSGTLVGTDSIPTELISGFSRFFEVFAEGHLAEHRDGLTPAPVAEVLLDIEGGTWRGGSKWDVLVYSTAANNGAAVADYTCGYKVRLEGALADRFAGIGALAQCGTESRGRLDLSGNGVIRETGYLETRQDAFKTIWSGVYGHAFKGYLGITGSDFDLLDNSGHGIFLTAGETKVAPGPYPVGAFLGVQTAEIHGNAGAGISMLTADSGQAIVGGTWHEEDDGFGGTFRSLINDDNNPTDLPHGQGYVSRCAISNNGEHGISMRSLLNTPSGISCRFVNDVIWNHPLGGVVGFSSGGIPMVPLMAVPIHGCTIAGNGSTQTDPFSGEVADYNVEFFEISSLANNVYEWTEPFATGAKTIGTRITNSILIKKNPGGLAQDFGPYMVGSEIVTDERDPSLVPDHLIGIESVRRDPSGSPLNARYMTEVAPQFFGASIVWTDRDPAQLALASLDAGTLLNNTWPEFLFGVVEASQDFLDMMRDGFNELSNPSAEMGAFELQGQ